MPKNELTVEESRAGRQETESWLPLTLFKHLELVMPQMSITEVYTSSFLFKQV